MRSWKAAPVVLGVPVMLTGFGLIAGGGLLLRAHATQRDENGWFQPGTVELTTSGAAIASGRVSAKGQRAERFIARLGSVQLTATPAAGAERELFVGIAPASDVEAFLTGCPYDTVTGVTGVVAGRSSGLKARYVRLNAQGSTTTAPAPGQAGIWAVSASGPGVQQATWDVRAGDWTAVIMNANGSAGVDASVSAAVRSDLIPVGGRLLLTRGLILAGLGMSLVIWATRARRSGDRMQLGRPDAD